MTCRRPGEELGFSERERQMTLDKAHAEMATFRSEIDRYSLRTAAVFSP